MAADRRDDNGHKENPRSGMLVLDASGLGTAGAITVLAVLAVALGFTFEWKSGCGAQTSARDTSSKTAGCQARSCPQERPLPCLRTMRERLVPILFTGRSGGEEHNKS